MKLNTTLCAAIVLALLTLALLVSCNSNDIVSDDTTVADETTATPETIAEDTDAVANANDSIDNNEWRVDGNTIISPKGETLSLPEIPEWEEYEIISYWPESETRCLLEYYYQGQLDLYLVDITEGVVCLLNEGQTTLDYTVAYDTVYWFNLDRTVWASSWTEAYPSRLFCEEAIAVSPFCDECEGAIVEPGRENITYGYNGLPIYSPYGIVD